MVMPRTPRPRPADNGDNLARLALEYVKSRQAGERFTSLTSEYKNLLMERVTADGEEDDKGHRTLILPAGVDYTDPKGVRKQVVAFQRQRKGSTNLNEDRTLALLARKGLVDQCTYTVTVVDEDAVLGANFADKITDEELASLYDHSESFAFLPIYEQ